MKRAIAFASIYLVIAIVVLPSLSRAKPPSRDPLLSLQQPVKSPASARQRARPTSHLFNSLLSGPRALVGEPSTVPTEQSSGRKLTKFVSDHVLRDVHRHELVAIVDSHCMSHELR